VSFFVLFNRKSASCTHVSALLPALASLAPSATTIIGTSATTQDPGNVSSDEEVPLPITSYICQWNVPRKRKESNLQVSEAIFHKHVYGKQRKHELKAIEDFDPLPSELRGKAKDGIPQ
jgi:P pilus assembly chaperone PapD